MYSSENLERFYFQYQTEAVPWNVNLGILFTKQCSL